MLRPLLVLLCAFAATSSLAFAAPPMNGMGLPPQPKVRPAGIPAGAMMLSPCIRGMGDHWGNPKAMPLGPIYGTYQGKPIFSEIMVTRAQLDKGISYYNLRPLPGYKIDHVNLEWHPKGHPGLEAPHYDIHAYYIPRPAQLNICPNGLPDPDMEKGM